MADLLTHLTTAQIPGTFLKDRRVAVLFVIGTFMPDIVSKGLYWVTRAHSDFTIPGHSLVGLALLAYLSALLVEVDLRRPAFWALFLGAMLHVGVDHVRDNLGWGTAHVFYPFTTASFELPWVHPENLPLLIPIDLAVLGVLWLATRKKADVR